MSAFGGKADSLASKNVAKGWINDPCGVQHGSNALHAIARPNGRQSRFGFVAALAQSELGKLVACTIPAT
jgi:hypothetical protein